MNKVKHLGRQEIETFLRTYIGNDPAATEAPYVPVVIHDNEEHIRVVLGGEQSSPDIYIERQPGKWCITIHPEYGRDPVLHIEYPDAEDANVIITDGWTRDVGTVDKSGRRQ